MTDKTIVLMDDVSMQLREQKIIGMDISSLFHEGLGWLSKG